MKNRVMFVFWLLGNQPQIVVAVVIAILLALVVHSHSHGADLNDRDPWVGPGYLTVETVDGWHFVWDAQGNRVASYCHSTAECPNYQLPQPAWLTSATPADWIADGYSYDWWEDGAGFLYTVYPTVEVETAYFCMAGWACDTEALWPLYPMSHDESNPHKVYLPIIGGAILSQ